jgi:hypothetical protein
MEHCDLGRDPEILSIILQPDVKHINLSHNNINLLGAVKISAYLEGHPPVKFLTFDNNKFNDDNIIAINTHTTCGQLPTSITHASSTMMPFAAILQASKALSDLSSLAPGTTHINILLSNIRQSTIDPSSITLRMPPCPGIVTSPFTDALPQTLPALRTEYSRCLCHLSYKLYITSQVYMSTFYVLCLHLYLPTALRQS